MSALSPRPLSATLAGIALIVLPLIALGLKAANAGWLFIILVFFSGIVWLAFYVFAIVMAITGFLRKSAWLTCSPARLRRGSIAAGVHGVALVVAAFFVMDTGDGGGVTSPFIMIVKADEQGIFVALSELLASIFAALSAGAYVWLAAEWYVARRDSKLSAAEPLAALSLRRHRGV